MSELVTPLSFEQLEALGVDTSVPDILNMPIDGIGHVASQQLPENIDEVEPRQRALMVMSLREQIHDYRQALTKEQLAAASIFGKSDRAAYLKNHKIDWEGHLLTGHSEEEEKAYREFLDSVAALGDRSKGTEGDTTRERVDSLMKSLGHAVELRDYLVTDPAVLEQLKTFQASRFSTFHKAAIFRAAKRRDQALHHQTAQIQARAQAEGRNPTLVEKQRIEANEKRRTDLNDLQTASFANKAIESEITRRGLLDQSRSLRNGLLVTESLQKVINRVLPSLKLGKPLFLMGETGGAKTALAKHISREYFGVEPEVLDGNPEMSVYSAIGKTGLRANQTGTATESYFDDGPLYRAMAEGKPCIGDEIDNMPTAFLIGLNRILQLRPGDSYTPPGSSQPIVVKPGFCFIATANMKSERYNRQKIDPSTLQRFRSGAGVEMIRYPDADEPIGLGTPRENTRLATAALVNEKGRIHYPAGMDATNLTMLVKAAHISQRLFSDPSAIAEKPEYCPDSQLTTRASRSGEPVLKEAVIAPRELIGILDYLNDSYGAVSLEQALASYIATQQIPSDREILSIILGSHKLLNGISERQLRVRDGLLAQIRPANS